AGGCWNKLIEHITDAFDHLQVRTLAAPANVISLARSPFLDDQLQRPDMVFHVEPVADVGAIAVDRQWLFLQSIEDHERDEFFGKLVRSEIIGAVRYNDRQAEGAEPCFAEMIGSRLAGRIGR